MTDKRMEMRREEMIAILRTYADIAYRCGRLNVMFDIQKLIKSLTCNDASKKLLRAAGVKMLQYERMLKHK